MSVSTYAELQSAISDWLARSDLTTGQLQNLIIMFESFANRRLRVRQMETSTALTTSSGVATLPTDYLYWRTVTWNGSPTQQLIYASPETMRIRFPNTDQDVPAFFTIEGTTLTTAPIDDTTTITFRYYQKIPALTDSAITNWLLTAHPDLYLAGSLAEANAFLIDGQAALLWKAKRDEIIGEIIKLSDLSKAGGPARPHGWIV